MTRCCESTGSDLLGATSAARGLCPACGAQGKPVERITLMALLKPPARARLTDGAHRFCSSAHCDIVYFDESSTLSRDDLNVPVGQKATDPLRTVCYCFNHTVQSIIDEIASTGRSTAVESITAEIKAKRCACEVTNPQGTCCLGNVGQAVQMAPKEK